MAVILLEARDLRGALEGLASSPDGFDVWFHRHVADVHGIDLAAGAPLPEQVLDSRG